MNALENMNFVVPLRILQTVSTSLAKVIKLCILIVAWMIDSQARIKKYPVFSTIRLQKTIL